MLSFLTAILASWMALVARFLLVACLVVSVGVHMGWIQRWVWIGVETFLSFLLNGTPVSIGSLTVDWWRGRVFATNVVIHTPRRDEWKWDSPLIARIGRCYVEVDAIGYVLDRLDRWFDVPKLDIYTAEFSDIQVFVERRQHVFNFYLLDPTVELPDPRELLAEEEARKQRRASMPLLSSSSLPIAEMGGRERTSSDAPVLSSLKDPARIGPVAVSEKDQAQEIVDHLFQGLKSLGHAAQHRGWKDALFQQRETLTQTLQQFQQESKKVDAMQEDVRVMRQVSETIAKQQLRGLEVPVPKRREDVEDMPPPNVRVGRVVVKEARIFTRDNWVMDASLTGADDFHIASSSSCWNKPICLQSVVVRASELCPPMSLLDEHGLPALYQPLDKVVEVVWKRILSSMAQTQTGRLFNTALLEVLGFVKLSQTSTSAKAVG